jgi:hypothetical protein
MLPSESRYRQFSTYVDTQKSLLLHIPRRPWMDTQTSLPILVHANDHNAFVSQQKKSAKTGCKVSQKTDVLRLLLVCFLVLQVHLIFGREACAWQESHSNTAIYKDIWLLFQLQLLFLLQLQLLS